MCSGLGLHLQSLAQKLPGKYDLHEPHRLLADLTPYEHLHRMFRVCAVHGTRNIRRCPVSEEVRNLMRSLICLTHDNWDGTLDMIRSLGGKAGSGLCLGNSYFLCSDGFMTRGQIGSKTKSTASLRFRDCAGRKATYLSQSGRQGRPIVT